MAMSKIRVRSYYNGYMTGGRFLTWSLVVVPAIIYHCNAVDSMEHLQRV